MLQVAIGLGTLVLGLGLDQAFVREYHEVGAKASVLFVALSCACSSFFVFSLLVVFRVVPLSAFLFGVTNPLYDALFLVLMLATLVATFLRLELRMEERALAYSIAQIWPKLIFVPAALIVVSIFQQRGFLLLYSIYVLSFTSVVILLIFVNRRILKGLFAARFDRHLAKQMLVFGIPLIFSGAAFWGLSAIDRVSLRWLATFEAVGVYSIAATLASGASIVGAIFSTIWSPTVYKWAAQGEDLEQVDTVMARMLAAVVFIYCFVGVGVGVLGLLFPVEYRAVQWLLLPCLASPLLYALSEVVAVGIGLSRKSYHTIWITSSAFVLNGIGNYLLIPHLGAVGAAVSTALSFWVFFVLRTEVACSVWRPFPRLKLYSTTAFCVLSACGFALAEGSQGIWNEVFWAISFAVFLFIFKSEIRGIIDWLPSRQRTHSDQA